MRARTAILATVLTAAAAQPAAAFCGFYVGGAGAQMFNNATEVVLMRHGTTTILSMENNYQGPPEGFALVVPVPVVVKEQNVRTLDRALLCLKAGADSAAVVSDIVGAKNPEARTKEWLAATR